MIAPFGIGGRAAAACVGAVDHVIVNQRCAMQKLDHSSEADRAAILATCITRGKKQERGTHALPSAAKQIGSDFRNGRKSGVALSREFFFNQQKVVADEIKNLFSPSQRDGKSPELTLVPDTSGRDISRPVKTQEAPKLLAGGGGHFRRRHGSHISE